MGAALHDLPSVALLAEMEQVSSLLTSCFSNHPQSGGTGVLGSQIEECGWPRRVIPLSMAKATVD